MKLLRIGLAGLALIACAACQGGPAGTGALDSKHTGGQAPIPPTSGALSRDAIGQPGTGGSAGPSLAFDPAWVPAPTYEMLMEEVAKAKARGEKIVPRPGALPAKSASWTDQGGYVSPTNVMQGEYESVAPNGTPPWGCNKDGGNSANGHAIEDIIINESVSPSQRISYVLRGSSQANYFNVLGGAGNDAFSAVYQLFSTSRDAIPENWESSSDEFAEISYRSDLAPGIGPGGICTAEAHAVEGWFWKRYNSINNALPGGASTAWYNILIAPASDLSTTYTSSGNTVGRYQEFYFGSQSPPFNQSWITGLESSTSDSSLFNGYIDDAQINDTGFFYRAITGSMLLRWQRSVLNGMAGPWETDLGWPVAGPIAYKNGAALLLGSGVCYIWGIWFERGFMWWVDFDQGTYPNTPDVVLLYRYTGVNVYDPKPGDHYYLLPPAMYYGGSGPLKGSAVVDSYKPPTDLLGPWVPVNVSPGTTGYYVELDQPTDNFKLAMYAGGCGGVPDADGQYKYYAWDFGDGQIQAAGAPYDPAQAYAEHTYDGSQSEYEITVTITDASFDLGVSGQEETVAVYSLPVQVKLQAGQEVGRAMLLMSQSHGYQPGWVGANGWSGLYGFSVQGNSVPAGQQRLPWAAGLATNSGIGPGPGNDKFIPTAPQNVIGAIDGRFGPDSYNAAERYHGPGSSGNIPVTLDIAGSYQFCGLGYYRVLMEGREASRAFCAGVSVSPPVSGVDIAYVSYGNRQAPDASIGNGPSYSHQTGPGRLWVVGYPWSQTTIAASAKGGMTRADMLLNILTWLDPTVFTSGGGGSVLVIRNDGGSYNTNFDALLADLDALGAPYAVTDYSSGIAQDYIDGRYKCAIWYRGGPAAGGEPATYATQWTSAEIDDFLEIIN